MAATNVDLGNRILRKLKVIGEGQTGSAEDLQLAEQYVRAAHASIRKDKRVRWTIQDLPEAAEEPYVLMAAFLAAPDFSAPQNQNWWLWGEREINQLVQTDRSNEPTRTEYF